MSFQNYGEQGFPGQPGGQQEGGAGPGGPPQPQEGAPMSAQMPMDQAAGQYAGNGQPGSAGGQPQDGDQKTTLWYVQKLHRRPGCTKKPRRLLHYV